MTTVKCQAVLPDSCRRENRKKEIRNVKINKQFQKSLALGWRLMFSRKNVFGVLRKA
jgi:hypothetical protein